MHGVHARRVVGTAIRLRRVLKRRKCLNFRRGARREAETVYVKDTIING